jgi:hypothetical protein
MYLVQAENANLKRCLQACVKLFNTATIKKASNTGSGVLPLPYDILASGWPIHCVALVGSNPILTKYIRDLHPASKFLQCNRKSHMKFQTRRQSNPGKAETAKGSFVE